LSDAPLWIFGYGSLVWRPAFPHLRACPASITGYARRFWQGSTDHRGLPGRPGRVVTLIANQSGDPSDPPSARGKSGDRGERCWGTAYEIRAGDSDEVLAGLDHRERGGYERVELAVEIWDAGSPSSLSETDEVGARSVTGLVYIAGPDNDNFLGAAPLEAIARQISMSAGPSGPNPEYVFELANRLREMGAGDAHVFAIEAALQRLMS